MKRIKLNYVMLLIIALIASTAIAHDFEVDGIFYNINENTVTVVGSSQSSGEIIIPKTVVHNGITYSVTSIGDNAFYLSTGLTNIIIPNSITSIGSSAFFGCSGLTSLSIPSSVKSIGNYSFLICSGLTKITVENGNPEYDSRGNCNALIETKSNTLITGCKNTIIPNSVTSIGFGAFQDCHGLTNIVIPNSVTIINNDAFYNCSGLTYIEIPNSVMTIGDYAFSHCLELTSVDIPNSVILIGKKAFSVCSNLRSISIPNSVTSIGNDAFGYCSAISFLFITGAGKWPETSLIRLPTSPNLFIDSRIEVLNGAQVPHADVYCFSNTPPECDNNSFSHYSGTLHVPAASVAKYFTASYWCNFANLVGDAVEPSDVTISSNSLELQIGDNGFVLTALVIPANATPNSILWESSNRAIATVKNGTVTAVGPGECDIIAKCLNKKAKCHVVVNDTIATISLDQHEVRIQPNEMVTLTPTSSINILPELAVTSSDPSVAAARVANDKIQVVGIKVGTATITVGSVDGLAIPDSCVVTVYSNSGDVNGDGEVNIADVNAVIDQILSGNYTESGDVNGDGEVNIADVNAIIDTILSN